MRSDSPTREVTTLRTLLWAVPVAGTGILLLYLTSGNPPDSWLSRNRSFEELIRSLGALLFSSVALYAFWELAAKRAFMHEIRAEVNIPRSLEAAGIIGAAVENFGDLDWHTSLAECKRLEVFVSYANTWRNNHRQDLSALASRKGATVTVYLPDPENLAIVAELSDRFDTTPLEMTRRITEAATDFTAMFAGRKAKFSLWYIEAAPLYSFYRFDKHAYLALYKHRRGREYPPPTIVIRREGSMWKFLQKEIESFVGGSKPLGRKIK